jgi:hypothetical protein
MSLLVPFWASVFDELGCEAHWVICLRRPEHVARSLYVRDHFSAEKSLALWLKYNLALLQGLGAVGALERCYLLSFDELLVDASSAREKASALLRDLKLNEAPFFGFFETQLASAASSIETSGALWAFAEEVHATLLAEGPAGVPLERWLQRWRGMAKTLEYIDLQYESLCFLEAEEKKWVDGLEKALADKDAELARADSYAKELLSVLEAAKADAEKQRDYTRSVEKDLNAERVEAERRSRQHNTQLQILVNRCQKYFVASSEMEEALHHARTELESLKQQFAEVQAEHAAKEAELRDALGHSAEELRRVYSSTSWKVSAPIRAVKRGIGAA